MLAVIFSFHGRLARFLRQCVVSLDSIFVMRAGILNIYERCFFSKIPRVLEMIEG